MKLDTMKNIVKSIFIQLALACLTLAAISPAHAQFSDRYEFIKALKDGETNEIIAKLESGVYPDSRDADGTPAIIIAMQEPNLGLPFVALLLKHGASINITDRVDGKSVLLIAAQQGNLKAVQFMISQGANINATDNFGETPLVKAVRGRHYRVVRELLDEGADAVIQDRSGNTALDHAINSRDRRIEKLLRDAVDKQ